MPFASVFVRRSHALAARSPWRTSVRPAQLPGATPRTQARVIPPSPEPTAPRRPTLPRRAAHASFIGLAALSLVLGTQTDHTIGTPGSFDIKGARNARLAALAGPGQPVGAVWLPDDEFRTLTLDPRRAAAAEALASERRQENNLRSERLEAWRPKPSLASRIRHYRVKRGDTLFRIAQRFKLKVMSVWWSNSLQGRDEVIVGERLLIPPVDGVVHRVTRRDTMASVAKQYGVKVDSLAEANGIEGLGRRERFKVNGWLLVPNGRGRTAKPRGAPTWVQDRAPQRTVASEVRTTASRRAETSRAPRTSQVRSPNAPSGSGMLWPVAGGSISRGYGGGHLGIDIQAPRGTTVYAARGGTVIFAGWRGNGGGYQVWISHGGNLYTTYNHMAWVSTGHGASVSAGQPIGAVGATGYATGPHLHFEVWIGPIWAGGYRANPSRFL